MSILQRLDRALRSQGAHSRALGGHVGIERRLVLRLLTHWRALCGERRFATFDEIDPTAIPEMWPHCFVLDTLSSPDDPVFRIAGEEFASHSPAPLLDRPVSAATPATLVAYAVAYVPEVLRMVVPVSRGGRFVNRFGATVLYRSILLPMSDDGVVPSGLLGAANCREVADG